MQVWSRMGFRPRLWARRALNVGAEVAVLERRVAALEELARAQAARSLDLGLMALRPGGLAAWFPDFLGRCGLPGDVDPTISRDDRMFQYAYRVLQSFEETVVYYFVSGWHSLAVIEAAASARFGSLAGAEAALDFAAGHGRLGRFLARAADPGRVWVSDIKAGAVEFQVQRFGVNGLISSERPEDFRPGRSFDIIFVGSLFSHLPDATFGRWLGRLFELLSDRGVLLFSVHDMSLAPAGTTGDFLFNRDNEDHVLDGDGYLDRRDRSLDVAGYGSTWVAESYVARRIGEACGGASYVRYPRGLWSHHDLYLVSPGDVADLRGLPLPDCAARFDAEKAHLEGDLHRCHDADRAISQEQGVQG